MSTLKGTSETRAALAKDILGERASFGAIFNSRKPQISGMGPLTSEMGLPTVQEEISFWVVTNRKLKYGKFNAESVKKLSVIKFSESNGNINPDPNKILTSVENGVQSLFSRISFISIRRQIRCRFFV
jgi:hypothetical protein